jgi:hypothetical protein
MWFTARNNMADAHECRQQATECTRLSLDATTSQPKTILSGMARSWNGLANQMIRLCDLDPSQAKHLALPR